jgi:hypothetical protein
MPRDYIPKRDAEYNTWISNFQMYAAAHAAELGLTPAQALELLQAKTMWGLSYSAHIAAREAAGAAQTTKEEKKADATKTVRQLVNLIQARKETTDGQRRALAITVPDREPTPLDPELIQKITPEMELDFGTAQRVIVHVGPNPKDENNNGLPYPAAGFRLHVLYSAIPAGTENLEALPWTLLVDHTHSPFLHLIGHAATVTYRAQYFDRLMNLGPLGPPESCSVTA